jgi:hypothetical protein
MSQIYCTIEQLSTLFRLDYSSLLGILHKDANRHPEVKKFNRYVLSEVTKLHTTTADAVNVDLDTQFMTLYEVQDVLSDKLGPMVYSTVLRKAAKGEIPALKFGDTYRVPGPILERYLQQRKISYRTRTGRV